METIRTALSRTRKSRSLLDESSLPRKYFYQSYDQIYENRVCVRTLSRGMLSPDSMRITPSLLSRSKIRTDILNINPSWSTGLQLYLKGACVPGSSDCQRAIFNNYRSCNCAKIFKMKLATNASTFNTMYFNICATSSVAIDRLQSLHVSRGGLIV